MSGTVLSPGLPGAVALPAPQPPAQPAPNALLLAHPLMRSRGPLPPRDPTRTGASPPISTVAHTPLPPRMVGQPHGAPVPAPAGLPGLIVRVGPAGGDAALAHLGAGHSPGALVEAAANSLAMAAMVNGRLDPARYAQWVQQRLQFLAHVPDAAALFGSVEAAERTIQAVMSRAGAGASAAQPGPAAPHAGPRFAVRRNDLAPVASPATSYADRLNPLLTK